MTAPTADRHAPAAAYRLPTSVRPHAYRLVLTPDLGAATFAGDVEIDVTVTEPVGSITLNAAELEISFAELTAADPDDGYALAPTASTSTTAEERAMLTFPEPSTPGRRPSTWPSPASSTTSSTASTAPPSPTRRGSSR